MLNTEFQMNPYRIVYQFAREKVWLDNSWFKENHLSSNKMKRVISFKWEKKQTKTITQSPQSRVNNSVWVWQLPIKKWTLKMKFFIILTCSYTPWRVGSNLPSHPPWEPKYGSLFPDITPGMRQRGSESKAHAIASGKDGLKRQRGKVIVGMCI